MRRLFAIVACGLLLVMALAGCKALSVSAGPTAKAKTDSKSKSDSKPKAKAKPAKSSHPAPAHPAAAAGGSGTLQVLVEPTAGVGAIYKLITGAKSSVELTMYELRDTTAENDLAADAKRGVDVRVILDSHLEKSRNTATYDFLSSHRVHVTWADSGTTYHQKTLTVDGKTSVIMTLNMVTEDYAGTRDFAVIDTNHADVARDRRHVQRRLRAPGDHPAGRRRPGLVADQLAVVDPGRDQRRQAHPLGRERGDGRLHDHRRAGRGGQARRRRGGHDDRRERVGLRVQPARAARACTSGSYADSDNVLYIHAKAVVADAGRSDQQVFVGSENFSKASLGYNRELGLRTANKAVISVISATLAADYAGAKAYSAS